MRILLAGATGVIGRTLVPMLVRAGHEVAGMANEPTRADLLRSLRARPVIVDVMDRAHLFEALRAERPDAVIDEITSLRVGDYAANNRVRAEGTRNLVDAAQAAGVARVVAQSYCLYAPRSGLASEDDPLDLESDSFDGSIRGILALEQAIGQAREGVILRYGALYGPGTGYAPEGGVTAKARSGELVATEEISSFIHLQDAARAALLALHWPPGVVNIVDDEPAPGLEWVPAFAAAIGAPPPPTRRGTGSHQPGVSNAKAREELAWEPTYPSWREGFRLGLGAVPPGREESTLGPG